MRFRCLNGRHVVVRLHSETTTPGGLFIPDSAQKKSEVAVVRDACAEWVDEHGITRTAQVEPGDACLISKYSGEEFSINGRDKVVVIRDSDILSVIEDFGARVPTAVAAHAEAPAALLFGDGIDETTHEELPSADPLVA